MGPGAAVDKRRNERPRANAPEGRTTRTECTNIFVETLGIARLAHGAAPGEEGPGGIIPSRRSPGQRPSIYLLN